MKSWRPPDGGFFFCRPGAVGLPRRLNLRSAVLRRRTIKLALQGGGALGTFTLGVLDRLIEESDLAIEAVSSAGAMNALAMARGFSEGGAQGAQNSLKAPWTKVASASYAGSAPLEATKARDRLIASPTEFLLGLTRFFSPLLPNPFDINPLRSIIDRLFDFERIRQAGPLRLFVGAAHVRSGALRVFREGEFSADAIRSRLSKIQFNTAFLRKMRGLALARRSACRPYLLHGVREGRRLWLRPHAIETQDEVSQLELEKSMNASLPFLLRQKGEGRDRAQIWIWQDRGAIGRRASLDLERFAPSTPPEGRRSNILAPGVGDQRRRSCRRQ